MYHCKSNWLPCPLSWLHPSCRQAEEAVIHLGINKLIAQDNQGELRPHTVNIMIAVDNNILL